MRRSLVISGTAHAVLVAWGLIAFVARPSESPHADPLPVEFVSATQFSQLTAGVKNAPEPIDNATPLVDKVGEPNPVKELAPKVVDKPEIKIDSAPTLEPKPEAKSQPKIAEKSQPKPGPKAEPKPAEKADKPNEKPKPEAKSQPKIAEKSQPKPEPKAEPKPAEKADKPKDEPKPEAKSQPKIAEKSQPKPEPKPAEKADKPNDKPKPEAKSQPKIAEKSQPKPEPKAEPKPAEKADKPKDKPKPDQVADELKKDEAKKTPKPEKKQREFKPDQTAEELKKDEAKKQRVVGDRVPVVGAVDRDAVVEVFERVPDPLLVNCRRQERWNAPLQGRPGADDVVFHRDRLALLSSELNAQIEHQTARDSTVGADKPLGERGTVMADTVGAKQAKEPAPANGFY